MWSWGRTSTNHAPQNSTHPQQSSHLLGWEIETGKQFRVWSPALGLCDMAPAAPKAPSSVSPSPSPIPPALTLPAVSYMMDQGTLCSEQQAYARPSA